MPNAARLLRADVVGIPSESDCRIESVDIEAALEHVRSKGARVDGGMETRLGVRFFTFYDPDNNGLMVCESNRG